MTPSPGAGEGARPVAGEGDGPGAGEREGPRGTSVVVGVIGDPVAHSLSPVLHNAAFAALGLDWVSVAFPVAPERLDAAVAGVRALGMRGVSVTMPYKEAVATMVDRLEKTADRLGAVNCLVVEPDGVVGDNTDGDGFLEALRRGAGFDPAGRRCLVVGAGGAAKAVVLALGDAGSSEVVVVGRTPVRVADAVRLAGTGRPGSAQEAGSADLVVNATPLGMAGTSLRDELPPVDPALLGAGQLVVDLVYAPRRTRWLQLAEQNGAATLDGLGMLVHQAARQIELWTGRPPPAEAMWRAVADRAEGEDSPAHGA